MSPIVRHVCRHCWVAGKSETFQFRANKTGRKQSQLSHLPFGFFACKRTTTGGTTQLCYTRVSVTKQTTKNTMRKKSQSHRVRKTCVCLYGRVRLPWWKMSKLQTISNGKVKPNERVRKWQQTRRRLRNATLHNGSRSQPISVYLMASPPGLIAAMPQGAR